MGKLTINDHFHRYVKLPEGNISIFLGYPWPLCARSNLPSAPWYPRRLTTAERPRPTTPTTTAPASVSGDSDAPISRHEKEKEVSWLDDWMMAI